MHALFFEVRPVEGHLPHYFEHVARLRPVLARHTGLLFLDRYSAQGDPGLLLSHQLWQDEAALVAWRRDPTHRASQAAGRRVHFADYRIRVGVRALHWQAGVGLAQEAAADGPHVVAVYGRQAMPAGFSVFDSVNHAGNRVALAGTSDLTAARAMLDAATVRPGLDEGAAFRILRDYGQFDRAQAPERDA